MKRFRKGERQSIRRLCVPSIQQCQSVVCRQVVLFVVESGPVRKKCKVETSRKAEFGNLE